MWSFVYEIHDESGRVVQTLRSERGALPYADVFRLADECVKLKGCTLGKLTKKVVVDGVNFREIVLDPNHPLLGRKRAEVADAET